MDHFLVLARSSNYSHNLSYHGIAPMYTNCPNFRLTLFRSRQKGTTDGLGGQYHPCTYVCMVTGGRYLDT